MEDIMLGALARAGALGVVALLWPSVCLAWGNEGHKIVALTAAKILSTEGPATLAKVNAILGKDKPDAWPGANVPVATDIGDEATWAESFANKATRGKRSLKAGISLTSTSTIPISTKRVPDIRNCQQVNSRARRRHRIASSIRSTNSRVS